MTTKVLAGNLSKERQLCAALYVRPVIFATAAVPPSASITSFVVPRDCMGPIYIQRFLDNQAP